MSFKAAASELGVTPTAISHQVQMLEEICGRELFRRRPLTLTAAGAELFPVLRTGLDFFATTIASITGGTDRLPLRVTCTNAFAHRWLVPRLSEWQTRHPEIVLDIIGTDTVLDLRTDATDLAIRYQHDPPAEFFVHELCRDTFWVVASPDLLTKGPPITQPSDLAGHRLIHAQWDPLEPRAPTWSLWVAITGAQPPDGLNFGRQRALYFQEELHAIEAVIAGQGVAICSDVLISRELKSGALIKLFDQPLPGLGFYLVHKPQHARLPLIRSFLAWIKSVFRDQARHVTD